jgi:hypothetical protein
MSNFQKQKKAKNRTFVANITSSLQASLIEEEQAYFANTLSPTVRLRYAFKLQYCVSIYEFCSFVG